MAENEVKTEFDSSVESQVTKIEKVKSENEVVKGISDLIGKAEVDLNSKLLNRKKELAKEKNPDLEDKDLETAASEITLDKSEEDDIKQEIYDNVANSTFRISDERNSILEDVESEASKLLEDINKKKQENELRIEELSQKEGELTDREQEEISNLEEENATLDKLASKIGSREDKDSVLGKVSKGVKQQKGIDEAKDNLLMEKFPEQAQKDERLQSRIAKREGKEAPQENKEVEKKDIADEELEKEKEQEEQKPQQQPKAPKSNAVPGQEGAPGMGMAAAGMAGLAGFENILGYNPDNILTPASSMDMLNKLTGRDSSVGLTDKQRLELLRDPKCQEVLSKAMETLENGKNQVSKHGYKDLRKSLSKLSKDVLPEMALKNREGVDQSLLEGVEGYDDKDITDLFSGNPPRILTDKNIPQEKLNKVDDMLGRYNNNFDSQKNQIEETLKNASPDQADQLRSQLDGLNAQKDALYRSVGDVYGAAKFKKNAEPITRNQMLKIGSKIKNSVSKAMKTLGGSTSVEPQPTSTAQSSPISTNNSAPAKSWKDQTRSNDEIAQKDVSVQEAPKVEEKVQEVKEQNSAR